MQVAAFRTRPPALAIADRLVAKGLPAYVADPVSADAMEYFRVRVGHYDERVDANRVRQQLIADGSLDPWVVRSATPATR